MSDPTTQTYVPGFVPPGVQIQKKNTLDLKKLDPTIQKGDVKDMK